MEKSSTEFRSENTLHILPNYPYAEDNLHALLEPEGKGYLYAELLIFSRKWLTTSYLYGREHEHYEIKVVVHTSVKWRQFLWIHSITARLLIDREISLPPFDQCTVRIAYRLGFALLFLVKHVSHLFRHWNIVYAVIIIWFYQTLIKRWELVAFLFSAFRGYRFNSGQVFFISTWGTL